VEALLRWRHPELGILASDKIIPLAEEIGQILPISEWVLRTASLQSRKWQAGSRMPIDISIGMNISTRQYQAKGLVRAVGKVLAETGLQPELLDLEITENLFIQNPQLAAEALKELKALGVKISLDDFGTGYSSLSYLYQFPIDTIKIDRSFVYALPGNTRACAIATAIISMAHHLSIKVVAEGVESEDQMQFLRSQGCDRGQGFFFSPPVEAEEIHRMFAQGGRLAV
jgi:EAL domain-containing protein (putative c-di-GMP-specific phosphodiesterase class I)